MLERHNAARGRVGAPPLEWSAFLALQAEAWGCGHCPADQDSIRRKMKKGTMSPSRNRHLKRCVEYIWGDISLGWLKLSVEVQLNVKGRIDGGGVRGGKSKSGISEVLVHRRIGSFFSYRD